MKLIELFIYLGIFSRLSAAAFLATASLFFSPFLSPPLAENIYISLKRCHNSIMLIDTLALSAAGLSQHGALVECNRRLFLSRDALEGIFL